MIIKCSKKGKRTFQSESTTRYLQTNRRGGVCQCPLDNKRSSTFDPHLSGGVDLKYLTLLTDFSAGLSLTGYYILGANIPAASAAFVLRYTF
jgi:hypothetical protein